METNSIAEQVVTLETNLELTIKKNAKEEQRIISPDRYRDEDNDLEFLGDTCNFLSSIL